MIVLKDFQILLIVLIGGIFGICLLAFTGMHVWMVLENATTLESMEGDRRFILGSDGVVRNARGSNLYNLGWRRNWVSVMGPAWKTWILPIPFVYVSYN